MLKKYPYCKQSALKDCGPASLLMILKFYGGNDNIDHINELSKTTKKGTTAYNLIIAAKELGFMAKGIKTTIESDDVILPCIAHVIIDNTYKHYVVIYQINYKKQFVLIADPSDKIKKMSFEEFNKIWTNILIILYPIKPLLNLNKNHSLKQFFINTIKTHQGLFVNIIILSFFVMLFSIISSYAFKYLLDSQRENIICILTFFLTSELLNILTKLFRNKILIYINQKIDFNLTIESMKKIIHLPYHYYHTKTTGDIISRINDLDNIRDVISSTLISIFIDLPFSLISGIVLYFINEKLFFISLLILIFNLLINFIFKDSFNSLISKSQTKKADTMSYMVEAVSGFETIKGLSIENNVINKIKDKHIQFLNKLFSLDNTYNLQFLLKELVNNLGILFILFSGCLLVMDNKMTIGNLLVFQSLLIYFLEPSKNLIELNYKLKEAKSSLKRVLEIMDNEEDKGLDIKLDGDIVFKNLSYSYDDINYQLKNINLIINKNSRVLIIGPSGSGKSTILKIIMKYYKVKRDSLLIGENDINDYDYQKFKNDVCYISQNEIIFTDTLINNLKLDRKLSNQKILDVAKLCEVDKIIKNEPLGYNYLLEENGFNISGGERQRIILARSLLKNSKYLFIDEGLNQMDHNLERRILKKVFNKYKDKTIIIISHRLENMDLFDKVIKVHDGKVEEVERAK